jgi:hypothetical protein
LIKILSTSGPFACRASIVLRKREDDRLKYQLRVLVRRSAEGGSSPLVV